MSLCELHEYFCLMFSASISFLCLLFTAWVEDKVITEAVLGGGCGCCQVGTFAELSAMIREA